MQTILNTYPNVFTPAISSTITNIDWLNKIINSDYIPTIQTARQIKQLYIATNNKLFDDEYKKLKKTLPVVTWNATFTGSKSDVNFRDGTGLIFIDIDDESFDISLLDKDKIYSYYKSVGGLGYCILVQCTGVTPVNYKSTLYSITDELGITEFIDKNAAKLTQSSIISHDKDLFLNPNSFVYSSIDEILPELISNNNVETNTTHSIKKTKHMLGSGLKIEKPLRYNNIDDFIFDDGDYLQNWNEGFDFIKCYLPTKKLSDGRKSTLLSYSTNLICLNPNSDYIQLYNSINTANLMIGIVPLSDDYVKKTVTQLLELNREGKLYPIFNKRRILFNPKCGLDVVSKQEITTALLKSRWANVGLFRLNEIIEDWSFERNGKITTRSAANNSDMNIKTIKKYWYEFKNFVKDLNELNKAEIRVFNERKKRVEQEPSEKELNQLMVDMDVITLNEEALIGNVCL